MRISGPTSLKIEELGCTLFKTRTKKLGERLYLSIKEKWSTTHLHYELRRSGYLRDRDLYINIDGLFNRINSLFNGRPGRFIKSLKINFDDG